MFPRRALISMAAICASTALQLVHAQTIPLVNADFEQSDGKGWVVGWDTLQHAGAPAYRFVQDSDKPFQGKFSARIEQTAPQEFGAFKQTIDARPYVGKRLKLSMQVRGKELKEAQGRSGIYVRIDGPGDAILANDFSSGATRGTHDWQTFRSVFEVPTGAVKVEIGVMLQDFGTMWVDSVQLEVTNEPVSYVAAPPVPSTITFDKPKPDASPKERKLLP